MARKNKKRISVDIHYALFDEMKAKAEFRNITITDWLIQAIQERLMCERDYE